MANSLPGYAELVCTSNYSFLTGASHPEEYVDRAVELGYAGLAIADECTLAGVVRAHVAAKAVALPLMIASQFRLDKGPRIALIARSRKGYGDLSELITLARRRADKGSYQLHASDIEAMGCTDCVAVLMVDPAHAAAGEHARWLAEVFPQRGWIGFHRALRYGEDRAFDQLREISAGTALPLVAVGDVLMHRRSRKPVQDTLSAIRLGIPLARCGRALASNAEQHLRSRLRLARLYPPEMLAQTLAIAESCQFSLDELRYEYPREITPEGETLPGYLRRMVEEGARQRYPNRIPQSVNRQIEHELALIAELHYEAYFLTVFDIVRFARSREILCQGRGSAANSAVCYCLGITEVDPARGNLLFERFISRERGEPPDIDVDFEHQRREEVIQYIYARYGRDRAALAATVISYRPRSAIRDVGRALGIDLQRIGQLSKSHAWERGALHRERLEENGFDPDSPIIKKLSYLVASIIGFPRHLSQHVGGFVISEHRLSRLVPIENASMADRTVIQWDKDDLAALGLLKVDVLALGMLSAIRRALDLVAKRRGAPFRMQDIPAEDAATYDMICRADTVGVFQIESRAQMSMLPRLRPRCFYDLVIEVAIVRPGPIQGGMVHPYLRRRCGEEPVDYPSAEVRQALERTLGVPIFQEQVMQLAVLAAGFTPGEADGLRRAMAAWKRRGGIGAFHERVVNGMTARGYKPEFAEQIFRQIEGFGEYGFPESHAASFALLVYISCWLKCHEPAVFLCAMLNSQPLGFYSASQLIQDGQRHGLTVLPVDVTLSEIDSALIETGSGQPHVRLGLNRVKGLGLDAAQRVVMARKQRAFIDTRDISQRAALDRGDLQALAAADALQPLAGNRHGARWSVAGIRRETGLLAAATLTEAIPDLPAATEGQEIVADYASLGLTLRRHPLALLRPRLTRLRLLSASELRQLPDGRLARTTGLVTVRQRPGTAKGTMFVTLEDETGTINIIVWESVAEKLRRDLLAASLLTVYGRWQRHGDVMHLIAQHVVDHSHLLGELVIVSRDFH